MVSTMLLWTADRLAVDRLKLSVMVERDDFRAMARRGFWRAVVKINDREQ